jgi:Adenylate and Guanylate cyclase catalytic domain
MDFKSLAAQFDPARIILYLNEIIDTFDKIDENYDVFKVETKADASYMVVAGLSDRLHIGSCESRVSQVTVTSVI